MKRILLLSILCLMLVVQVVWGQAPETISYQGVLAESDRNAVPDGDYSLTFRLYDVPANGTLVWEETQQVAVLSGIFNVILGQTIPLNLPFDQPYWLGITVEADAELAPRIELTASAYSLHARSIADSAVSTAKIQDGAVTQAKLAADVSLPPGGQAGGDLTGAYPNPTLASGAVTTAKISDDAVTGDKIAPGQVVKSIRVGNTSLTDEVILAAGSNVTIARDQNKITISAEGGAADDDWTVSGDDMFAAVSGNVGIGATSPTEKLDVTGNIQVSGTIKSDTLEFHVGGKRALRIEPTDSDNAPNMIGGFSGNNVTPGVIGATIGGGGKNGLTNRVTDNYGTVGGGDNNQAGDGAGTLGDRSFATVGGGQSNTASGKQATIGGGFNNTASGERATIGGGRGNRAEGLRATVGGGLGNFASGKDATIPGGQSNVAAGSYSFAAGRRAMANHDGTFVWADQTTVNFASTQPNQFLIRAAGGVGIGTNNPNFRLDVVGNRIRLRNSTATGAKEIMMRTDGGAVDITASNADLFLSSNTGNTIIEQGNGNVGIGTSSPGFKLHVNGSAGKPGGGSWSSASDKRLKDIRGNFERGLQAVVRLQPVVYTYKKDNPLNLPADQEYVGLIAQEVEKVIPEAVEKDKGEYLHLNNDPIIWSMLNAIKELNKENVTLKRELHQTTAALSALQAKVAQFETSLQKLEVWPANSANNDANGMSKISMK